MLLRPCHCCLLALILASMAYSGSALYRVRALPGSQLLKTVKLRIYGSSLDDWAAYLLASQADKVLSDIRFDPSKPTAFYFFGYTEHPEKESVRTVMSAFVAQGRYNAILVDWTKLAAPLYPIPLLLLAELGHMMSSQLDAWHEAGALAIPSVYLVGHSLGGQAAGFTGKFLTRGKVPRITVLDAALPGFNSPTLTMSHVAPSDALFVDAIHTDGGNYGVGYSTAHADFFPNGGLRLQPGCPAGSMILSDDDFCSHWRSWRFFAESLNATATPFYGLACASQDDFQAGRCAGNQQAVMGYPTPPSTRGTFFLETSDASPFSKGAAGLTASSSALKRRGRKKPKRFWFF